ncbi:MAG TPA: hypothetical protein EYH54_02850 [Nautiliaceae bacterium]|nr:hypothetical protein [Nautiliaceae bacterium]
MFEKHVISLFGNCNLFCLTLIASFFVIIEQTSPLSFFSPLLFFLVLVFYYLLLMNMLFYSLFLVFLFSILSFLADFFYFKFINKKFLTKILKNLNIKIKKENFQMKKRTFLLIRFSPLFKAIIYENMKEKLLKKERFFLYLFFSHLLFYFFIFSVGFLMYLTNKKLNLKYFDLIIFFIVFAALKKIIEI